MRSAMAGLSARLPPALLSPATLARLPCQSIGGWRLGGIGGVLFAQRQLALQIRDLSFRVRDLLLGIGDLLPLVSNLFGLATDLPILLVQLPPQPFDLTF